MEDKYFSADAVSFESLTGQKFIAHRGNHKRVPENTLPAFEQAHYWGVETDIHLTKDHEWVIMHDPTVDRMTNGTGFIK